MNRWLLVLIIVLSAAGVGAAAPMVAGPEPETLVEGHTVFTVLEQTSNVQESRTDYAAAVAVLVQEVTSREASAFPGVLWFNDQYLVDPANNAASEDRIRYPCTGAVLMVNQGDPDPRAAFAAGSPQYRFSYYITDPNDQIWYVDAWNYTGGTSTLNVWTVAILNNQDGSDVPDDGTDSCRPVTETTIDVNQPPAPGEHTTVRPLARHDSGYMDGNGHAAVYNALLYVNLTDLTVQGVSKDHTRGSTDSTNDVSGCQSGTTWDCPAGDDDREGNSHPYNPYIDTLTCPRCDGSVSYAEHGGSGGSPRTHSTWDVDIYYGTAPVPAIRNFVLVDVNDGAPGGALYEQWG